MRSTMRSRGCSRRRTVSCICAWRLALGRISHTRNTGRSRSRRGSTGSRGNESITRRPFARSRTEAVAVQIGADAERITRRLAAIDHVRPVVDRVAVERALGEHFCRLGIDPLPVRWVNDAETGYLACYEIARDAESAAWSAAWSAAGSAARSAAES